MKLECYTIKDLLPDYVTGLTNEKVNSDIEEHLNECEACREIYQNMKTSMPKIIDIKPKTDGLKKCKKKKRKLKIILWILALIGALVFALVAFIIAIWVEKDYTTNIKQYNKYLGSEGTHSEHILIENDIFPDEIPESAEVEDFMYNYYNPWDPCYANLLVYTCNSEDYQTEIERLKSLNSSQKYKVYGITEFPDTLCSIQASTYYGIVYAMTQEKYNRIIYVEITFCNYFTDIDYEKYIDEQYLPIGFDATNDNPIEQKQMEKSEKELEKYLENQKKIKNLQELIL